MSFFRPCTSTANCTQETRSAYHSFLHTVLRLQDERLWLPDVCDFPTSRQGFHVCRRLRVISVKSRLPDDSVASSVRITFSSTGHEDE